jgi:hypothetical protein
MESNSISILFYSSSAKVLFSLFLFRLIRSPSSEGRQTYKREMDITHALRPLYFGSVVYSAIISVYNWGLLSSLPLMLSSFFPAPRDNFILARQRKNGLLPPTIVHNRNVMQMYVYCFISIVPASSDDYAIGSNVKRRGARPPAMLLRKNHITQH